MKNIIEYISEAIVKGHITKKNAYDKVKSLSIDELKNSTSKKPIIIDSHIQLYICGKTEDERLSDDNLLELIKKTIVDVFAYAIKNSYKLSDVNFIEINGNRNKLEIRFYGGHKLICECECTIGKTFQWYEYRGSYFKISKENAYKLMMK